MKDYKEVADRVFQRSGEILAKKRENRQTWLKACSAAIGLCFVFVLGLGICQALRPAAAVSPERLAYTGDSGSGSGLDGSPDGYSVSAGTPAPDSGEVSAQDEAASSSGFSGTFPAYSGPLAGVPDDENSDSPDWITIVSSYGDTSAAACYAAPENGSVGYSIPLANAMEEYGSGVIYQVVVDVFRDGQPLDARSAAVKEEIDRLASLGYTTVSETYYSGGMVERHVFSLHATAEQLTSFAASGEYGYILFLHDERVS